MQAAIGVLTVVLVGLLVGVELAVAAVLNPIFDRLPGGAIAARSDAARVLGRVMPFWYFGSVALAVAWTALTWSGERTWPVATAAALLAASVLMTIALLVPINARVARWTTDTAPADWKQQVHRWDRLHNVRVGILLAAFVLLAYAPNG